MKTIYKCEICDRAHDTAEDASKCENGHTVIKMKWWWLIRRFMIPFSLFSKKNAIIKPKNFKERIMLDFTLMSPIILMCLILLVWAKLCL